MISKELLNEVLEEEVLSVRPYISDDPFYKNVIMWEYRKNTYDTINIYELAHKCKEWAKNKEYIVHSSPTQKIEYTAIAQHFDLNKFYYGQNQFYALSEYEAIFKACQWILEEFKES